MDNYKQIPVVIPALEPDDKLLTLLGELRAAGVEHILLLDDGSGAAYQDIFHRAEADYGCTVLRHAVNLGKGRALKDAFNHCLLAWPDAPGCVTADSDGQHTPDCILACAQALMEHPDALVLGCRDFDDPSVPGRSSFGNKCTRFMFKLLIGLNITDTQTGLRAIPAAFMRHLLSTKGERYEFESNMLIETKDQAVPLREVPIATVYLDNNSASHFNPIRDSLRIYSIFGKFLFSSLSSSLLDLLLFSLFCSLLRGTTTGLGYITGATVLARILSATYNFTINYKVVFKSTANRGGAALRYLLLAVVQMSLSAVLVRWLFPLLHIAELLVKIPVDILLFFVSFQIQREFVYKKK